MKVRLVFLCCLALVASGCGREVPVRSHSYPSGPGEVVVRIERMGGFAPAQHHLTAMPSIVVLGDGSVVTQGPQIMIFPGPALPNLLYRRVSEEGIQAILGEAEEAGLIGEDKHYDLPGLADATTTVFTVVADGSTTTVSAYALGSPDEEEGERALAASFEAMMFDLQSWLPEGSLEAEERPFEITLIQIATQPAEAGEEADDLESIERQRLEWPLATPPDSLGEPYEHFGLVSARCAVLEGDEAATMVERLTAANQLTRWLSDGREYVVYPRPLIGDEEGCRGA